MTRRILQLDGAKISVSAESRFDSERDLHDAVAAHPELLPSEDLGLARSSRLAQSRMTAGPEPRSPTMSGSSHGQRPPSSARYQPVGPRSKPAQPEQALGFRRWRRGFRPSTKTAMKLHSIATLGAPGSWTSRFRRGPSLSSHEGR